MQKRDAFRKFAAYLKGPNGKKIWIAATGVFLAAVCLCLTGVIVHRRNTAEIPVAESVTPGTTVTEVTTLPTETQSETATETTTKKPAPKPVGTTKPVERDEPALPQSYPKHQQKPPIRCLNVPFIDQRKNTPPAVKAWRQSWHFNITACRFRWKLLLTGICRRVERLLWILPVRASATTRAKYS